MRPFVHLAMPLLITICFAVVSINIGYTQIMYTGPADNNYFGSEFNSTIDNLSLKCSNKYNGETTDAKPVIYYKLQLTKDMKNAYKSVLNVNSCCEFEDCQIASDYFFCNKNTWGQATGHMERILFFDGWYDVADVDEYNKRCGATSSDTILYLLYENNTQITLLDAVDDVALSTCGNTHKSLIDLRKYDVGEYIIAIGSTGQAHGAFFIQIQCETYSYPVKAQELDPLSNNPHSIQCGTVTTQQMQSTVLETNNIVYYKLNVTDMTSFPVTISFCVYDAYIGTIYIVKRTNSSSDSDMDAYEIIEKKNTHGWYHCSSSSNYGTYVTLRDAQLYSSGAYYVALQSADVWGGFTQYTLNMSCGSSASSASNINVTLSPTMHHKNRKQNREKQIMNILLLLGVLLVLILLLLGVLLGGTYCINKHSDNQTQLQLTTVRRTNNNHTTNESIPSESDDDIVV